MTDDEVKRKMKFIIEQQVQLSARAWLRPSRPDDITRSEARP